MEHYQKKCKELIDQADTDSYCKAAANLMLNSDCEYLDELKLKYKDKLAQTDFRLFNDQIINMDE